ncbi:MAG: hypothetical protein OXQ29_27500 [Rhodospirillaceae bacterium]|nr:hypothetical protein [Rhodospirillaceae bacterium]
MQGSNSGYQPRAIALYLLVANLKGVSFMKLHRIREGFTVAVTNKRMASPVEADEAYIAGKEKNKHKSRRLNSGRGTGGTAPVVAVKDWLRGQIAAQAIPDTKISTIHAPVGQGQPSLNRVQHLRSTPGGPSRLEASWKLSFGRPWAEHPSARVSTQTDEITTKQCRLNTEMLHRSVDDLTIRTRIRQFLRRSGKENQWAWTELGAIRRDSHRYWDVG